MDDVGCTGSETSLAACYHRGWGVHDCSHDDDVSISCEMGKRGHISATAHKTHVGANAILRCVFSLLLRERCW